MIGELDPNVIVVILGMSIATYVTKAGGLWVLSRVDISPRMQAGLEILPGAIVMAFLVPELLGAGLPAWIAAAVVLVIAWATESMMLALVTGTGCVFVVRHLM